MTSPEKKLTSIVNSSLLLLNSEHLVKRYNKSLLLLTGKETKLKEFHIDCCGYSPEIAKEFKDLNYLNPHGVNRQFILVDIAQEDLPSLRNTFSSSPYFIKSFIKDNREQVLALTAMDSLYGHIENHTHIVSNLDDILTINNIEIFCDTPKDLIKKNIDILNAIDSLSENGDEGYLNILSMGVIAEKAKELPSIKIKSYIPNKTKYIKKSFYTEHFGGFYVLSFKKEKCIIYLDKNKFPLDENGSLHCSEGKIKCIHIDEHAEILNLCIAVGALKKIKFDKYTQIIDFLSSVRKRVLYKLLADNSLEFDVDSITPVQLAPLMSEVSDRIPQFYMDIDDLIKKMSSEKIYDAKGILNFYLYEVDADLKGHHIYAIFSHLLANFRCYDYNFIYRNNFELFKRKFDSESNSMKKVMIKYIEQ